MQIEIQVGDDVLLILFHQKFGKEIAILSPKVAPFPQRTHSK